MIPSSLGFVVPSGGSVALPFFTSNPTASTILVTRGAPSVGTLQTWDLDYREAGAGAWTSYATGLTGLTQTVADLDPSTAWEFRATAHVLVDVVATASGQTEASPPNPPPTMSKNVIQSFGEGHTSSGAVTRAAGSYLMTARNPFFGVTTCSSVTFVLFNPTTTPIPIGRIWATQTGTWSANIAAISKLNIGTNPANSLVAQTLVDAAGNAISAIPAGDATDPWASPGYAYIHVAFGPGGSGSGSVTLRFECPHTTARQEIKLNLASGFYQAQCGWTASVANPSSTESLTWSTIECGSLVQRVVFHTAEDVCNIACGIDSLTRGFLTGDEGCSWSYLAQDRFREAGLRINLVNYGRSGGTSAHWMLRMQDKLARCPEKYTAVLTKTDTVNDLGGSTVYTQAQRDADVAEAAAWTTWFLAQGIAPLFYEVSIPPGTINTSEEAALLRSLFTSYGTRFLAAPYRSLLVDPDADIPATTSGFLRPDNLHLTAPTNAIGVAQSRPSPATTGADQFAITLAATLPAFLDVQGVPR